MGPVTLESFHGTDSGFSADMPAGPGKHHFEAVYTPEGIHVTGTVIMEGSAVGTYEADMKKQIPTCSLPTRKAPPAHPTAPAARRLIRIRK